MFKKILIFIYLFISLCHGVSNADDKYKILIKINNQIVTNIDIKNEIKYLIALNPQLKTISKKQIEEIAKKSIIKENLKKSEIQKYYILDQKSPLLQQILAEFYQKLGMSNVNEFNEYLTNFDLLINDVIKKIEVETLDMKNLYQCLENLKSDYCN